MLYVCEMCGKEVTEKYGKGRFCGVRCAAKFSSKVAHSKKLKDPGAPKVLSKGLSEIIKRKKESAAFTRIIGRETLSECDVLFKRTLDSFKESCKDVRRLTSIEAILTLQEHKDDIAKLKSRGHNIESAVRIAFSEAAKRALTREQERDLTEVKRKIVEMILQESNETLEVVTSKVKASVQVESEKGNKCEEFTATWTGYGYKKPTRTRERLMKINERSQEEIARCISENFPARWDLWVL